MAITKVDVKRICEELREERDRRVKRIGELTLKEVEAKAMMDEHPDDRKLALDYKAIKILNKLRLPGEIEEASKLIKVLECIETLDAAVDAI